MTWHNSLLQSILERQKDPQMATARKLSDLDQTEWRRERRQRKREIREQLKQGALLAEERDINKRLYKDMSATEKQTLEDFDCNITSRQYKKICITKPARVYSKMIGLEWQRYMSC